MAIRHLEKVPGFPENYRGVEDVRSAGTKGKYVNQGFAQTTNEGDTLESEGFVQCSALILRGAKSKQTFMAHIITHGLTEHQAESVESLPSGKYIANVVKGRRSLEDGSSLSPVLDYHIGQKRLNIQIEMEPDIEIDADRFSVSFNSAEDSVKIVNRERKEIFKVEL